MTAVLTGALPRAGDWVSLRGLQTAPSSRQAAVWYRAPPSGQPQLADLVAIREMGFTAIVWPNGSTRAQVDRMAEVAGLSVITPEGPEGAGSPDIVHLRIQPGQPPERLGAQAWRQIQLGARVVAFDPGETPGAYGSVLTDESSRLHAWVEPARILARQLSVNATLFDQLQPGPAVSVRTAASDLLVTLFQTSRSWVLFATSLDGQPRQIEASLPPGIPAALWISLIDGSAMSMLSRPEGPLWRTEVAAYGAHIYVIDRAAGGGGS